MNKNDSKLDQILELVIEASSDALDKKREHKSSPKDYVSMLKHTIKNAKNQSSKQVTRGARAVNDHVHDKPWYYVAGAAIGGLVLGLLYRRSK